MPSTSIVVDLGFGDAGKGTIVDALARRCSSSPLVVRFNGGAQAAHNVHTSDGRHHTFSQFGSASFMPGGWTLLSEHMIVHPTGLLRENERLIEVGVKDALHRLLVHERSLVITPYQQAANRMREKARGAGRHGTCGLGIGETVGDSLEYPEFAVRTKHLLDRPELRRRMIAIRDRKRADTASLLKSLGSDDADVALMEDATKIDAIVDSYMNVGCQLRVIDDGEEMRRINASEHVIFEGSQGVLLDEWLGFHPHTTWSTTTTANARKLLQKSERAGDVRCIGVVRAYATRHGEGPFPTYDRSLTQLVRETHNVDTGWQGEFRVGHFDAVLTRYALRQCPDVNEIAVTCLDKIKGVQGSGFHCDSYVVPEQDRQLFEMKGRAAADVGYAVNIGRSGDLAHQERLTHALSRVTAVRRAVVSHVDAIAGSLGLPVTCTSHGPTAEDKRWRE